MNRKRSKTNKQLTLKKSMPKKIRSRKTVRKTKKTVRKSRKNRKTKKQLSLKKSMRKKIRSRKSMRKKGRRNSKFQMLTEDELREAISLNNNLERLTAELEVYRGRLKSSELQYESAQNMLNSLQTEWEYLSKNNVSNNERMISIQNEANEQNQKQNMSQNQIKQYKTEIQKLERQLKFIQIEMMRFADIDYKTDVETLSNNKKILKEQYDDRIKEIEEQNKKNIKDLEENYKGQKDNIKKIYEDTKKSNEEEYKELLKSAEKYYDIQEENIENQIKQILEKLLGRERTILRETQEEQDARRKGKASSQLKVPRITEKKEQSEEDEESQEESESEKERKKSSKRKERRNRRESPERDNEEDYYFEE